MLPSPSIALSSAAPPQPTHPNTTLIQPRTPSPEDSAATLQLRPAAAASSALSPDELSFSHAAAAGPPAPAPAATGRIPMTGTVTMTNGAKPRAARPALIAAAPGMVSTLTTRASIVGSSSAAVGAWGAQDGEVFFSVSRFTGKETCCSTTHTRTRVGSRGVTHALWGDGRWARRAEAAR